MKRSKQYLGELAHLLPAGWQAREFSGTCVVVGPTGVFVVADDDDNLAVSTRIAVRAAAELRERIAASLSWAPFVDALVVSDQSAPPSSEATVVPPRLALDVLTTGTVQLRPAEVARITEVVTGVAAV